LQPFKNNPDMKRRLFLFNLAAIVASFVFVSYASLANLGDNGNGPKARYVFYFIGDGMGFAQVNATEAYLASVDGRTGFDHLSFTTFPEVGTVSTHANNRLITCSAAAGTALATGYKTNIDRIAMDPEGSESYPSIAGKAHDAGYKVGIITSVSIDHATPAVFYAHQPDRNMYFEIGVDLAKSGFEYFAGGGFRMPDGTLGGEQVNLLQLAQDYGYQLVNTTASFNGITPGAGKSLVLSPRPAGEMALPYALDMNPDDLTLADFTSKAIEVLNNEIGFFMMVEGGKIDWAGHANDAAALVHEVIAFDDAVKVALEFYEKHPDETLIIVTADHETGGMSLGHGEMKYDSDLSLLKYQKSSVEELNKIVAQFHNSLSGEPEADFSRMLKVLDNDMGLNNSNYGTALDSTEIAELKELFTAGITQVTAENESYGETEPFMNAAVRILNKKAGIGWGTTSHTAINVPVYSIGAGSENFSGYMDNTDIPKIIGEVMGIGL
jgi:alkaline phosphatase